MQFTEQDIDPEQCPFCGATLASAGAGFMDHVDENPECDEQFTTWRVRIAQDIHAGWAG
ncbi:DUF7501 family protein [Halorubrum luteum]